MNYFTQTIDGVIQSVGGNPTSVFLGNTTHDYLQALIVFILLLVLFKVFQVGFIGYLKRLAKKTETDIDDIFIEIIESVKPPFYSFVAFYVAIQTIVLHSFFNQALGALLITWIVIQIIHSVQILISYILAKRFKGEEDAGTRTALTALGKLFTGALWAVGLLLILSNLGIDITSLIAGLGIGGVAIAFALQNILTDLFSSFAIYFDKPFLVGDYISIGKDSGTVLKIGIKTTRLRSLTGEELVISNKELTIVRIQNYRLRTRRRLAFPLGVVYGTSTEKLKMIPAMVQKIAESASPKVHFDRAHLKDFGSSSLDFEVVCTVEIKGYADFMDVRQKINLGIIEAFEKEKLEFAFPTQTVYL